MKKSVIKYYMKLAKEHGNNLIIASPSDGSIGYENYKTIRINKGKPMIINDSLDVISTKIEDIIKGYKK